MDQNENNELKKKKRFNLFDWFYRQGKDSDKTDINALKTPNIPTFFKLLWTKFGKLMSANIIFVFGNFPLAFFFLALSGWFDSSSLIPTITWGQFQSSLDGAIISNNYASSALIGIHGLHSQMYKSGALTYVFFALALLTIFTWGFTKVGTTYLYRNMMSGEPVFPFSDFFYIIKRNIKQSLLFGAIDFILIALLVYDVWFLFQNLNDPFAMFMLFLTFAMSIVYSFMRPYVYIMIFTFDLKFSKIIKNAASFIILGIKRNLIGFFASILLIAFNIGLIFIPYITPIGMILPFVITIAILDFIGVYVAYPNIIKYMMDPKDAKAIIERLPLEDDEHFEEQESNDNSIEENNQ